MKKIEDCMLQGPDELNEGECYFQIGYSDTVHDIPIIETWIYVGKNLRREPDGSDHWYFQDADSYIKHGSFVGLSDDVESDVVVADLDAVRNFHDFDSLREALAILKPQKIQSS